MHRRYLPLALVACLAASACARQARVRLSDDEAAKLVALEDRHVRVTFVDGRGVRLHPVDIVYEHSHAEVGATLVLTQVALSETSRTGLALFVGGAWLAAGSMYAYGGYWLLSALTSMGPESPPIDTSREWPVFRTYALTGLGGMAVEALLALVGLAGPPGVDVHGPVHVLPADRGAGGEGPSAAPHE